MKIISTLAIFVVVTTLSGCVSSPLEGTQTSSGNLPSTGSLTSQMPVIGTSSLGSSAGQIPVVGSTQTPSLVNILVQQLGISPQQATGGAGSIFALAKQNLGANSFGQVSQAVPGMSQLLSAAPSSASTSTSGSGSLMGMAANALGANSNLGNMASLASSFQNLGLGSGMVSKFIPVILQYVQTQGGSSTMSLLQGALVH